MKRIYYHGTSADNLQSILEYGLSVNENKIWNCSQDAVYLWGLDGVAESNGEMDATDEEKDSAAFKMAHESAQIACAISKDCRLVVVKVEIDDSDISIDDSCENMSHANCVYRDILPEEIVEIKISNDLSIIKAFFISILANNNYNAVNFSRFELLVAKAFSFSEVYLFEEIEDFIEWENVFELA